MYLALPVLYYLALRKRGVIYLFGLLAFFCGLGILIARESGGHLNMAAYVPCFLSGALCYSLRDRMRAFLPAPLWPPFVLLLISGYCLTNLHGNPKFWIGWIFCLILGLTINVFYDSANKALNAVTARIALYSYGMYLLHVPVLYLVFMVLGIRNLVFGPLLFAGLTMIASFITYHCLESPLIDFGRRLSSHPLGKAVPLLALAKPQSP
jgi:peptidoglycan/LPS O-acetylase OafA/YrhL